MAQCQLVAPSIGTFENYFFFLHRLQYSYIQHEIVQKNLLSLVVDDYYLLRKQDRFGISTYKSIVRTGSSCDELSLISCPICHHKNLLSNLSSQKKIIVITKIYTMYFIKKKIREKYISNVIINILVNRISIICK